MNYLRLIKPLRLLFFIFLFSGCTNTVYLDNNGSHPDNVMGSVRYDTLEIFHTYAPRCVTVLPVLVGQKDMDSILPKIVEKSVTRHLIEKVETVIGPLERDNIAASMALDLRVELDRERFLALTNCNAFIITELLNIENNYFVVWANHALDIRIRLLAPNRENKAYEEKILWIARHANQKSDGGLPFNPVSAGIGLIKASSHQVDKEQLMNIVEEAIRRIIVTLPDTRNVTINQVLSSNLENQNIVAGSSHEVVN